MTFKVTLVEKSLKSCLWLEKFVYLHVLRVHDVWPESRFIVNKSACYNSAQKTPSNSTTIPYVSERPEPSDCIPQTNA